MEAAAVHDAGNHLSHVVGASVVRRDYAVEFRRIVGRRFRPCNLEGNIYAPDKVLNDVAGDGQSVSIIGGQMVGHAGYAGMDVGPAQGLRIHLLTSGGPHQRWAAEEYGPLLTHHHHLVAHRGNVSAAGGAGPHDHCHLGNAQGGHAGLVVEDAAKVVPVGKYFRLQGQERAARVHQVDAGQVVFQRDFLGPQVFLDSGRVVGPALDGGVVGDDYHFPAVDYADAGCDACGGDAAVIHIPGGKGA